MSTCGPGGTRGALRGAMRFSECIEAIRTDVAARLDPAETVERASRILGALDARADRSLEPAPVSKGLYQRRLLTAIDDPFQLILAVWGPHSASPIHDHDGRYGAVVAYSGSVIETKYRISRRE